jgi:hypothetical protein
MFGGDSLEQIDNGHRYREKLVKALDLALAFGLIVTGGRGPDSLILFPLGLAGRIEAGYAKNILASRTLASQYI